jgi:hypothetical protein
MKQLCQVLTATHEKKFKVWTFSEREPGVEEFKDQVIRCTQVSLSHIRTKIIEFIFAEHFAPPLTLLFEAVNSMQNWLSEESHLAVVYCGKVKDINKSLEL